MSSVNEKMNELKTLKDLESNMMVFGNEQAINHLLRQEAIKWARLFKTGEFGRRSWELGFLLFFNLTEEDLK